MPTTSPSSSSSNPYPSKLQQISTLSSTNLSGSPAWAATFSIDGQYLAVCFGNPGTHVKIWKYSPSTAPPSARPSINNAQKEKEVSNSSGDEWKLIATIREEHTRTIRSVAFAPTSSSSSQIPILATASFDGKVLIWEHYADANDSSNDDYNNGYYDNDDYLDDSNNNSTFEPIAQLEGHENEIKCLAWNATGSLLASCGRDKTIWIWECFLPGTIGGAETSTTNPYGDGDDDDRGEFECLAVLQGHDGDVKSITFGPSHSQWGEGEEVLYSASYDDTIKVWAEESGDWYCAATLGGGNSSIPQSLAGGAGAGNGNGGTTIGPVHASTIWCLGLTPGGVRFFSGSEDGSLAIWKMYTASERKRFFPNSNGNNAICSTDGLWSCVGTLPEAHSSYAVLSVHCAPSRAGHGRIVSGGGDNCINVYREETLLSSSSTTSSTTNSGSGSNNNNTLDTPQFALDAVADEAHDGDVNDVRWHPIDGTMLVSCGDDGAVKIWRYIRGG